MRRPETLEAFKKAAAAQGPLDETAIRAKKDAEKAREAAAATGGGRGGAAAAPATGRGAAPPAQQQMRGGGGGKEPDEIDDGL